VPRKSAEEKVRINRILMIDDTIRSGYTLPLQNWQKRPKLTNGL